MRRHLKMLGLVSILAIVMTGCFKIGGFRFTKMAVPNGEKTVLEISLFPWSEEHNKDYPFIVLILPVDDTDPNEGTSETKVVKPKVIDVKGKHGGPHDLVADSALRQWILDDNDFGCDVVPEDGKIIVLRSTTRMKDKDTLNTQALTRIGLKYTNSDDPFSGALVSVRAIAGGWDDDVQDEANAGVPNGNEVGCNSEFETTYIAKSDPDAPEPTGDFRQEVRRQVKAARN